MAQPRVLSSAVLKLCFRLRAFSTTTSAWQTAGEFRTTILENSTFELKVIRVNELAAGCSARYLVSTGNRLDYLDAVETRGFDLKVGWLLLEHAMVAYARWSTSSELQHRRGLPLAEAPERFPRMNDRAM